MRCVGRKRLIDLSLRHARERVQLGKPIIENQGIQWMLADMVMETEAPGRWRCRPPGRLTRAWTWSWMPP